MPVTDAYATALTYRNVISKSDTAEDAEVLDDLTAVSRFIDNRLGRFFTKDAAAVARTFYPPRSERLLDVPDIAATTDFAIKVDEDVDGSFADESAWGATDYQLLPLNADKGSEPRPWKQIFVPSWSTKSQWSEDVPVQVTAIWGWPSVPKAIERACIHLTAILRLESPRATGRIQEMETVYATSREAQTIIEKLMRAYGRVGVA